MEVIKKLYGLSYSTYSLPFIFKNHGMSINIAIIGIDGSGKSTCFYETLRVLAEKEFVAGVGDDIWLSDKNKGLCRQNKGLWGATKRVFANLSKRYRNRTFYQITKFAELLCRVKVEQVIKERYNPKYILTDGFPLINVIGWGSFYHPRNFEPDQCIKSINYLCHDRKIPFTEMGFYLTQIPEIFLVNRLKFAKFSRPHIIFFLNIKPENAIARILNRGKELQVHETKTFLNNLQEAYATVSDILSSKFGIKVIKIPVDRFSIEETVTTIIRHIQSF